MENITWNEYFMSLVYLTALRSKDKSTKIGAIVVNDSNCIISTGYNSFPRGINDDKQERQERPEKYYWMSHGEENCISNAARNGISLHNCIMYTHGIPCMNCAKLIVQSGIKKVIVHEQWEKVRRGNMDEFSWDEHSYRTNELFKEAGVELEIIDCDIIKNLYFVHRGEKYA